MKEETSKKAIRVRRESAGDIRNFLKKGREDRQSSYRAGPQDTGKEGSGGRVEGRLLPSQASSPNWIIVTGGKDPKTPETR